MHFSLEKHLRKLVGDEANKIAKEYRAKLKKRESYILKNKIK